MAASQHASTSALPDLPAELLITVLENVDAAHILNDRLANKSFRDIIDTRVLYHHIHHVELIRYLGPKEDQLFEHLNAKDYWDIAYVKMKFVCLDDRAGGQPKWGPPGARSVLTKPGVMLSQESTKTS